MFSFIRKIFNIGASPDKKTELYDEYDFADINSPVRTHIDEIADIIQLAIKKNKKLEITYLKIAHDIIYEDEFKIITKQKPGDVTKRIVTPLKLDYGNNISCKDYRLNPRKLYLDAFCELRNAPRVFLVQRIHCAKIID